MRFALAAGAVAGLLVVAACAEDGGKSITAPPSGPRNATVQADPGVYTFARTARVCIAAGSPAGTYEFTNSSFEAMLGGTGGDGASTENVVDGTAYTVAVGSCVTVVTRQSPNSTFCDGTQAFPTFAGCVQSDSYSGVVVTVTTMPAGVTYNYTDCLLDAGVKFPKDAFRSASVLYGNNNTLELGSNPCATNNNPSTIYTNWAHGMQLTFFFNEAPAGRGQIAPTATTCADFANETSSDLETISAGFRGTTIHNLSPGVFFYFANVTLDGSGVVTTQTVTPNPGGLPKYQVHQGQAYLYTFNGSSCTTVEPLDLTNNSTTVSGGAGLTGDYILGIKFNTGAPVGTVVPSVTPSLTISGTLLSTHNFTANGGSAASVDTRAK